MKSAPAARPDPPRSAPLRLGRAVQEHALFAPDPLPVDRLDTRTAECAEPDAAGQPGRADAENDHDSRVIAHYETCGEDFYLQDHHDEHIHFGYWETTDVAAACERIDRSTLPVTLHRLIEVVAEPARIEPGHLVVDAGCGVGGTVRFLAREYGCRVLGLKSLQEAIDTDSSSGRLIFHIFGALAEFERALTCSSSAVIARTWSN